MTKNILLICIIICEIILISLIIISIYTLYVDFCLEVAINTIIGILASIVGFTTIKELV